MDREIVTLNPVTLKRCPDGDPHHTLVETDEVTTGGLDLPRGALLHVDRRRAPANGDVVLAELVVRDRLVRTVRRFTRADGVVSLARLGSRPGSLIRPRFEVSILGVVDGHIAPMDRC